MAQPPKAVRAKRVRRSSSAATDGGLKLDLDRFLRDTENLIRTTKKHADGFIAHAKESMAAAELDEQGRLRPRRMPESRPGSNQRSGSDDLSEEIELY